MGSFFSKAGRQPSSAMAAWCIFSHSLHSQRSPRGVTHSFMAGPPFFAGNLEPSDLAFRAGKSSSCRIAEFFVRHKAGELGRLFFAAPAGGEWPGFGRKGEKKAMHNERLPWAAGVSPLMLAPMQGLTNRALRGLFIQRVRPDVVFSEFVRVKSSVRKNISASDRLEVASAESGVPLVVQLIGSDLAALASAAATVRELGARHLNINLGCPFGRMGNNAAGGGLLRRPEEVAAILATLRRATPGSFSVKTRAGFDDPGQLFALLDLFAEAGVDFLVLHARTVRQRYSGGADHRLTAEVVRRTALPVIANGDIFTAAQGRRVLAETGAAGLMLGRGAIVDPLLFSRLRGERPEASGPDEKEAALRDYLRELLARYRQLFCGDHQILCKMKEVLCHLHDPDLAETARRLKRSKNLALFAELLEAPGSVPPGEAAPEGKLPALEKMDNRVG